jgi:cell division protein FtsB
MQNEMFQPEKPSAPPATLSMREKVIAWSQHGWRTAGTIVAVALAGLLMWHVFNGNHGLSFWHQKRAEDRALQKEIQDIQQENAQLHKQVDRLKSDPDAIEHEAREKLHYAKSGEVIYSLPTPPPADTQPPPSTPAK